MRNFKSVKTFSKSKKARRRFSLTSKTISILASSSTTVRSDYSWPKRLRENRFSISFCYTASVTVHAAMGGASSSLSVDMSNTYLDWARRNFSVNNLDTRYHRLERADCVKWLEESDESFDLIFMDPPAYSRSKKMDHDLDIQRDHPILILAAMKRLVRRETLLLHKPEKLCTRQFNQRIVSHQGLNGIIDSTRF